MGFLQTLYVIFQILTLAAGIKGWRQARKLQKRGQDILATKTADGGKLPVIYGTRRVGSTLLYMDTDSGNSKELFVVYGLSVGEIDDIDLNTIEINGVSIKDSKVFRDGYYAGSDKIASGAGSLCTASQIGKNTAGTGGQSGTDPTARYRMVFNAHHGSSTQTADPMLNASLTKWTSSHRLRGIAYIAASFEYDSRGMFSSTPELTVVCRGKKLYDPRLDGSISGGTGSHRINDSSTFEWSDNAALALLDYITNDEYGKGLAASTVNMQSFQTAADTADELVNVPEYAGSYSSTTFSGTAGNNFIDVDSSSWDKIKAGVYLSLRDSADDNEYTDVPVTDVQRFRPHTESFIYRIFLKNALTSTYDDEGGTTLAKVKRFHCNGVIDTNENVLENTRDLLSNIRGFLNYLNGKYTVLIEDTASSVFSVNDDHIIDDQGIKIQYEDKSKKYNKVVVNFFNGQKKYEADTVTVFHDPNSDGTFTDYKDNDGGEELELKVEFDYITNPYIAYNMGKAILGRSRNQKIISFLATPELFKLSVGDVIDITYAGLGLSSDYYRIEAIDLLENGLLNIQAIEYINVYDWDAEPPEENVPEQPDIPTGTEALPPTNLSFTDSDSSASLRPYVAWNENTNSPAKEYRANCYIRGGANDGDTVFSKITNDTFVDLNFIATGDYKIQVTTITTTGSESDPATLNFTVSEPPITVPDLNFPIGGFFRLEKTGNTNAPNDAGFNSAFGRDPIDGDILIVIQTDATPEESQGYKYQDTNADGIADDFVAVDDFFAGDLIIDGTLGAEKIVAGSITGDRIAARTIGAGKIVANSLTADEIAAGAITTTELDADAVTADKILAGTITATEIATGTLTSDSGVFGTISADDVTAGSLTSSNHSGTGNGSDFSTAGLKFNLNNGSLSAKNFRINSTGSAFFKGQVTAGTGTGTVGIGADADEEYNIFAGANNPESATFAVKNDGTVYLDRLAFKANNIVYFDENGFTEEARSDLLSGTGTTLSTYSYTSSNNTDAAVISTSDAVNVTLTGKLNITQIFGEFNRSSEAAAEADIPSNIKLKIRVSENSDFSGTDTHSSEQTFTADTTGTFIPDPSDGSGVTSTEYHVAVFGFFGLYQSSISKGYGAVSSTGDLDFVANSGSTVALSADTTYYIRVEVTTTDTSYDLSNYPANTGVPSLSRAIRIAADSGGFIVTNGTGSSSTVDSFQKIAVSGQSTITSDSTNANILTMAAGSGIALTTNASTDTLTIAASGSPTFTDLTVTGNLTVQGTTTTLETATLNVEDKNITLNYGNGDTSASANGAGITIQDAVNSTTDATILWNATNDRFDFSHTAKSIGKFVTTDNIVSGLNSGGVALTVNDGYGNANVTFNHEDGSPEQNGNAARIEVNTDSTSAATMYFELKSGVTSGVAVQTDTIMSINDTGLKIESGKVLYSNGDMVIEANDTDFAVKDSTDGLTNFIWRDWSAGKLYLGTSNAVATLRSTLDLNTNNITNVGTISSGAISIDGDITLTEGDKIKTSESSGGSHLLLRSDNLGVTGNSLSLIGLNDILIGSKSNQTGTGYIYFGYNAENKASGSGWVDTLTITDSGNFEFNNGNFTEVGTISSGAITSSGNVTATAFYGDGSNLTGVTSTTINSNADNRVITGSGTANTLNAESGLTYDGSTLAVTGTISSGAINVSGNNNITIGTYGTTDSGKLVLYGSTANKQADLYCSNGNLHIDADNGSGIYLNWWGSQSATSTNGTYFGNANAGQAARIDGSGQYYVGTTVVIDSSRNLTNIGTISSGAITVDMGTNAWTSHNIELSGTFPHIYFTDDNETVTFHLGQNGTSLFVLYSATNDDNYDSIIARFTSGGFQVDTNDINIVSGDYQIAGTTVIDSSRNLTNIGTISSGAITSSGQVTGTALKVDANYDGFFGTASFSWGGSTAYPTLYGSHPDRWVMICMPHIPYLQNGSRGYTGGTYGSTIRFESDTSTSANWDIGIGSTTDVFRIARSSTNFLTISSSGNSTFSGTISSGQINTTTTADATPAIIATNTGGLSSTIARFVGDSDSLEIKCEASAGDYRIANSQQNNGVVFYDGTGGIAISYAGTTVQEWTSTGGTDLLSGGFKINGTEVISSARNLTNIGTITATGSVGIAYGESYWIGNQADSGSRGRFHASGNNLYIDWGQAGALYFRSGTSTSANRAYIDGSGNINAYGGFMVNTTTVIDSSRNLTNIGTISSNIITVTGVNGRNMLTLQTNVNTVDRGISFQNSGGAYSNSIFVEDVGGNDGRIVFTGGNASSTLTSLSRDFMINNQSGGGGVQGDIHARGDVVAFSTTVTSDERLKYDIQNIENPIEIIKSLTGRHFKWKKNDAQSSGVIAQEVEKTEMSFLVAEKCDIEDPNKTIKRVKYDGFIGVLIEAIKEQQKQIEELQARLDGNS